MLRAAAGEAKLSRNRYAGWVFGRGGFGIRFHPLLVLVAVVGIGLGVGTPLVAAAPATPIRVTFDAEGPSTRIVLTAPKSISAVVTPSRGRLEIVYSEPVSVDPPAGRTDDAILTKWSVRGDRTVVLETGPGFRRFDTFNLKNPTRLVIDLEGERPARGTVSRGAHEEQRPDFVVVIDPGHGGVETGAVGPSGVQEKELTLDIARRLKSALQTDPAVGVVLTRDEDRLVPLDERTSIANHNRADLFLSIHLNAARGRRAVGAETYYLSTDATDDDARTVAALENRAYDPVRGYRNAEGESDPGLALVLWDLAQNQYLAQSSRLAESIQAALDTLAGTKNRGVRQAPFRVLMGATMPAVLVEVGFVSNPAEEALLKTDAHKDKIVEAIAGAIKQFRSRAATIDGPELHAVPTRLEEAAP